MRLRHVEHTDDVAERPDLRVACLTGYNQLVETEYALAELDRYVGRADGRCLSGRLVAKMAHYQRDGCPGEPGQRELPAGIGARRQSGAVSTDESFAQRQAGERIFHDTADSIALGVRRRVRREERQYHQRNNATEARPAVGHRCSWHDDLQAGETEAWLPPFLTTVRRESEPGWEDSCDKIVTMFADGKAHGY